ncbi:uncharacterized protein BX664DRAFT_353396 [Halteromyces radiatus]|uniref:uncharacterized protein n=1 Tax=Halteromyces radiatus TaxID=101107 RepID=UPI00221F19D1|nr:uncharacterized protein BX664DRAFT_353396 [Halteromyces radiatus]KAI8078809.1 hypothetical protein BX664DRAFT_353396 [Halteromyces radiatus]
MVYLIQCQPSKTQSHRLRPILVLTPLGQVLVGDHFEYYTVRTFGHSLLYLSFFTWYDVALLSFSPVILDCYASSRDTLLSSTKGEQVLFGQYKHAFDCPSSYGSYH